MQQQGIGLPRNCYIAIEQSAIRSPAGTYVPVIHRFIHRGRRYTDVRKGIYARKPGYVRMLIVSHGLHASHKCLRPALPALPRPADACKGGELICHRWITSFIRSWGTAPSGRCRGITGCNDDDGDDGEGPGFCGFLYMRQIIFDIGSWSSISAGCSTYGILG